MFESKLRRMFNKIQTDIKNRKIARPFLKWAGGKTQLIDEIEKVLPKDIINKKFTYIEPFVGSGAILFWMLERFPKMEKAVINDINEDLINTYKIIASKPKEIISILNDLQLDFHALENREDEKKVYYYEKRELYNTRNTEKSMQAALFIFLNRTCFNGLYRVNKNNGFNVPMGSYKKPTICDDKNILAVSEALQKVEILCGDFENTINKANKNSFFYFDPPYKPLSNTSSFNSYAKDDFNDLEQIRLKDFCNKIDILGYDWILSNSDVKGKDTNDNFFDELYANFSIERVKAKRSINANPDKRGQLNELLITNIYKLDYIATNDLNRKSFTRFDKPYWKLIEKFPIDNILIDKNKFSFINEILPNTVNTIVNNFDLSFWMPITLDKQFYLLDGQHRLEAAKKMNLKYIDVVVQDTELLTSGGNNKKRNLKKVIL